MSTLLCKNLRVEAAGSVLLDNVNFKLEPKEKAGLIGANGAGKTTLLRVVIGQLPSANGYIESPATIGYLPQITNDFNVRGTVFESLLAERNDILEMRNRLRYLEIRMSQEADDKILGQYSSLTEIYENSGGYALEAKIRRIIAGLGMEQEQDRDTHSLSGGQKTRLALGKLLLREPGLLILDEPTNHLDLEALEWLENYLGEYPGAVLVVSHDRYFLDQVVSKILVVENGSLKSYSGNYSEFELQRVMEEKTMTREAGKMNEKILALEEYIRRHKAGIKAKQARGRETQLKKLTPIAAPQAGKSLNMSLQTSQRAGDRVLDITGLSVAYEKNTVFEDVSLELRRGHRIALLGRNGVGKTSLLKAITGEVPYQGDLRLGANVKIGYYSQEHEDIGLGNNVKDIMDELRYCSDLDDPQIRTVLARFGFRGDDVFKPIAVLSGGEKSRLALCKLFLVQGNLLLLDEPTNHLDMDTREVLEEALLNYNGTMITVSHDRYFINRMVNRIALLTPKGIRVIEGDYTAYRDTMEKEKEESNLKPDEGDKIAKSYRLESKNNKRREKKVKQLEESIENTKMLLQELESKLESLTGDYELTLKLHNEYQMLQNEHDDLMQEWLAMND